LETFFKSPAVFPVMPFREKYARIANYYDSLEKPLDGFFVP